MYGNCFIYMLASPLLANSFPLTTQTSRDASVCFGTFVTLTLLPLVALPPPDGMSPPINITATKIPMIIPIKWNRWPCVIQRKSFFASSKPPQSPMKSHNRRPRKPMTLKIFGRRQIRRTDKAKRPNAKHIFTTMSISIEGESVQKCV